MTEQQIKHMVQRFLGWRLPEDFNPDAGISFKATFNEHMPWGGNKHEPSGTNLFDATQADAMVRYMVEGIVLSEREPPADVQGQTAYPHPACMEPDGGEGPCAGYQALSRTNDGLVASYNDLAERNAAQAAEIERLRVELAGEREKFTMHTAHVGAWLSALTDLFGVKAETVQDGCKKIFDAATKLTALRASFTDDAAVEKQRAEAVAWDKAREAMFDASQRRKCVHCIAKEPLRERQSPEGLKSFYHIIGNDFVDCPAASKSEGE